MTDNIQENPVVVLSNGAISNELRNDRRVTVDLVLDERIEILVVGVIRHDHQKDELGVLHSTVRTLQDRDDFLIVVVLNRYCERLKKDLFVVSGLIADRTDISKFDLNIKAFLS